MTKYAEQFCSIKTSATFEKTPSCEESIKEENRQIKQQCQTFLNSISYTILVPKSMNRMSSEKFESFNDST